MSAAGLTLRLGVNIDHAATLRQARYAGAHESPLAEPRLMEIARACKEGGADSITIHLREDRRHIQESDVRMLAAERVLPLNLEMAAEEEIAALAVALRPDDVCVVPERRAEVTTEGGLDVAGRRDALEPLIRRLQGAGVRVSLFIDPEPEQVLAAAELRSDAIELHTGAFSHACPPGLTPEDAVLRREMARLREAAVLGRELGLQVNAGHGINYHNISRLLEIPGLSELNIGHSIVSRALLAGMARAVAEMKAAMSGYAEAQRRAGAGGGAVP